MRRRQILGQQSKDDTMSRNYDVTNSNLISKSAPEALKKKAEIFMPHLSDIETPAATLKRAPRNEGVGIDVYNKYKKKK